MKQQTPTEYAAHHTKAEFEELYKAAERYIPAFDEREENAQKLLGLKSDHAEAVATLQKAIAENRKAIAVCDTAHKEHNEKYEAWKEATREKESCAKVWGLYSHNLEVSKKSGRVPNVPDCPKPEEIEIPEKPEEIGEEIDSAAEFACMQIANASKPLFSVVAQIQELEDRQIELSKIIAESRAVFIRCHNEYYRAFNAAESELRRRIREAELQRENTIKQLRKQKEDAEKMLKQIGAN